MAKPLLSIGIIFKNEIRCLERCLQALEPLRKALPCQLVMADTGSDDGSREIAARYADILFDFSWGNDFSAARNAVMDRCSGAWFFTVDSDEYLDPNISELKSFLTGPLAQQAVYASVIVRNYRTREMVDGDFSVLLGQRLVRMSTGIRYEGAIHECWPYQKGTPTYLLSHVVLHHDGYAVDFPEEQGKKLDRNLVLLRQELEKNPKNLRTLLECVESSEFHKGEQIGYLEQGMELVQHLTWEDSGYRLAAPHLCRHAVRVALEEQLPQAETWLAWGKEHLAQHIAFRIDVSACAALYFLEQTDFSTALRWAEQYEAGCGDYDAGRYELWELTGSSLSFVSRSARELLLLVKCACLIAQNRQSEAAEFLGTLDFDRLWQSEEHFFRCLNLLRRLTEASEKAQELCGRMLTALWHAAEQETEPDEPANTLRRTLIAQADCIFQQVEEGPQLFHLSPGDLGLAARSMELQDPERLTDALAEVERWEDVPAQAVSHAIKQCAPLPASFYRQSEKALRELASDLGADVKLQERLALWAVCDDFSASLGRCQFLFQLTAAAVMSADWGADGEPHGELLDLFGQVSQAYLPALYNPELLQDEEEWIALPALHRAALSFLQAMDARENGDELRYVRALRVVLQAAPGMKNAVERLLENRPKSAAQRQLEQLAEQVRAILAQYPPDDPAVIALKQSEAYRKVAHLLG